MSCHVPAHRRNCNLRRPTVHRTTTSNIRLLVAISGNVATITRYRLTTSLNVSIIIASRRRPNSVLPATITIISPRHTSYRDAYGSVSNMNITFLLTYALRYSNRTVFGTCNSLLALNVLTSIVPLANFIQSLIHHNLDLLGSDAHPNLLTLQRMTNVRRGSVATATTSFSLMPQLGTTKHVNSPSLTIQLLLSQSVARTATLTRSLRRVGTTQRSVKGRMCARTRTRLTTRPT